MSRIVAILLLTLFTNLALAQNEAAVWYFGEKAGLNFKSGTPVPIHDGQLSTYEGCATISDQNGNLLFYTNGEYVWNRNHQIMPNGSGLKGSYTSTHSAIVIPFPGNDALYYIFTTGHEQSDAGLRYSVVNMKQDNGLGDVITKDVLLLSEVHEKVAAVRMRNCSDYWVVTCKWNSNEYYAYLLTSAGISSPVISKTGIYTGGLPTGSIGQIKFSPDGSKLAAAFSMGNDFVELMDFDPATGTISNAIKLTPNPPATEKFSLGAYGIEFSPNSKLLYTSAPYMFSSPPRKTLYQYNITYNDPVQIEKSKKLIDSSQAAYGMQLGPDKRIYVSTYSNNVCVINSPNEEGAACGFIRNAIDLGTSSQVDFPTFLCSFFTDPIIASGNCEFQNINFSVQNSSDLSAVEWNFGDPASGLENTSTSFSPTHIYSRQGTYNVRLVYLRNGGCFPDTVYKQVYAGPFKLYLGKDTVLCEGDALQLEAKIPNATNLWSDGTTGTLLTVTKPGKYWVRATLNNCWATDTIEVMFHSPPTFSLGSDTAICLNSEIILEPKPAPEGVNYSWSTGTIASQIQVAQAGTYWLKIKDDLGCEKVDTILVSLRSLPQFHLGRDTILCQTTLQLNASVPGASNYQWNTAAITPVISITQSGIYWADVTKDNCTYRDSIQITMNPFPIVNLGRDTTLCQGSEVTLHAENPGASYQWQDHSTHQSYLVKEPGQYYVKVDLNGCSLSDSVIVHYDLRPSISLGPDLLICPNQSLVLQPSIQSRQDLSYLWQDGSSNPTYIVQAPGIYTVSVSNHCGISIDSITVRKGVCRLYVPNAFTPNRDGKNDVFRASFGENIIAFELVVYNRWGQRLFESSEVGRGWDGRFKGQLQPQGAYSWMIRYKVTDLPQEQILKGTVILVR